MRTTRIAAATAAVILAISSVALANGTIDSSTDATTSSPARNVDVSSTSSPEPFTTAVTVASSSSAMSTPGSSPTSTPTSTPGGSTTTVDDRTSTTVDATTSTTIDDSSDRDQETRSVVSLALRTYTVGEAGSVTVDGMRLVAVDANNGWSVEIDEASSDRIKVEFERGEVDAEFDLRADGELRIRTHD